MHYYNLIKIVVAGRDSPLSQAQIEEVFEEIKKNQNNIIFEKILLKSSGDLDLITSLRIMNKTDFFTKEIDECVLRGDADIGIHSAKDLPMILPLGLTIAAITQGIDSSDSIVFRPGDSLETLSMGAKIGTSSERREEIVKSLRSDLTFVDIRGNIEQRLQKLESKEIDALVIAEAALIRLKLTRLNRKKLPGKTSEGQGQLAIVTRSDNFEIINLFKCLDSRILVKRNNSCYT